MAGDKRSDSGESSSAAKKQRKASSSDSGIGKKRQAIPFETKIAIIKRADDGDKKADIAREYKLSRSTVSTICQQKDRILNHVKGSVLMKSTIISKRRGKVMEKMEQRLSIWLEKRQRRSKPVTLARIQKKALSIFKKVKAKAGEGDAEITFSASHGWFARFKRRANLDPLGTKP